MSKRDIDIVPKDVNCDGLAAELMKAHTRTLPPVGCVNREHGHGIINNTPQERLGSDEVNVLGQGQGGIRFEEGPSLI